VPTRCCHESSRWSRKLNAADSDQRLATRFAGYFVPAVLVAAVVAFIAGDLGTGACGAYALIAAVSVLIIACRARWTCNAMSIGVAVGKGASAGVLVKSAEHSNAWKKWTCWSSTDGTLTEGRPKVTAVVAAGDTSEAEILQFAASLERPSEHPLAAAIIAAAKERGMTFLNHEFRFGHRQRRYR